MPIKQRHEIIQRARGSWNSGNLNSCRRYRAERARGTIVNWWEDELKLTILDSGSRSFSCTNFSMRDLDNGWSSYDISREKMFPPSYFAFNFLNRDTITGNLRRKRAWDNTATSAPDDTASFQRWFWWCGSCILYVLNFSITLFWKSKLYTKSALRHFLFFENLTASTSIPNGHEYQNLKYGTSMNCYETN